MKIIFTSRWMNLFLFCTRDRKLLKFVNSVFLTKNVLIHKIWKFNPFTWKIYFFFRSLLLHIKFGLMIRFFVKLNFEAKHVYYIQFYSMVMVNFIPGKFSFWSQPDSLGKSTIKEFIEQCVRNSRNGQFLYFIRPSGPGAPPMPVHLLHPVSRFRQMQSLQHMCRFQILQIVRRDHIDRLPIPTSIKDYLRESQYYVEYLED